MQPEKTGVERSTKKNEHMSTLQPPAALHLVEKERTVVERERTVVERERTVVERERESL